MRTDGDYISREAAFDAVFGQFCASSDETEAALNSAVEDIKSIPAADVRPVGRGKWIKYAPHNSDMMTCSECEQYWILDGDQYDYHFCPNCGARMEES
jgi:NADH pyrophosphatase NudC (nudix superfamily)